MPEAATPSLPDRVREIFHTDGVLHEAISRGLVNYRALSRWLISTYDLKGSEDAVLSAVRRLMRTPQFDQFRPARKIISQGHLNVRSHTCQLMVTKSDEARRKLPQLLGMIDLSKGEMLYFTWGEFGIKILLDEANLGPVQELFSPKVKKITRKLSAVTVVEPEEGLDTPGILALLTQTLALRGINIVDAVYGYPDYTLFVKESDTLAAYQALESLVVSTRAAHHKGAHA